MVDVVCCAEFDSFVRMTVCWLVGIGPFKNVCMVDCKGSIEIYNGDWDASGEGFDDRELLFVESRCGVSNVGVVGLVIWMSRFETRSGSWLLWIGVAGIFMLGFVV